jgi:hypothetical protein
MKSNLMFIIISFIFLLFFLYLRIKQAITKKDEQVQGLRVQYETAIKRIEHLETLLSQQRKLISARPSSGSSVSKKAQPSS